MQAANAVMARSITALALIDFDRGQPETASRFAAAVGFGGGVSIKVEWRRERDLFLTAVMFLTRIPVPRSLPYDAALLNGSARYFPLVGLLVGIAAALVYGLAVFLWAPALALLLSMAVTILLTGAFHEDGLADTCDGMGGGRDRDRVLAIMKDSRIGTYGLVGLGLVLSGKFLALESLDGAGLVIPALLVGHTWSRLVSISYLLDLPYLRELDGKSKPLATQMSRGSHRFALITAAPLLLLLTPWQSAGVLLALLFFRAWYAYYLKRRLGGYTGDTLGAAQQFSELLIYLVLAGVTGG